MTVAAEFCFRLILTATLSGSICLPGHRTYRYRIHGRRPERGGFHMAYPRPAAMLLIVMPHCLEHLPIFIEHKKFRRFLTLHTGVINDHGIHA